MISVIVLGTGNVGTHLIQVFSEAKNVELVQVYNRKESSLNFIKDKVATTTKVNGLKEADVYIIAISDDAIPEFSSRIAGENKLIVHTSGSASIHALKNDGNKGVFYPLQTFSKKQSVDFSTIPICIETENEKDLLLLERLANSISNNVFIIDSEQRKRLHVAAVFTNNFVNYLYKIGYDICEEHNIPFETLHPLIMETAQKVATNHPKIIQTGPALRNDIKTIDAHLKLLSGEQKEIYQLLTESIKKTYGAKL